MKVSFQSQTTGHRDCFLLWLFVYVCKNHIITLVIVLYIHTKLKFKTQHLEILTEIEDK